MFDPVEDWDEVVATTLAADRVTLRVDLANRQLLVECAEVED